MSNKFKLTLVLIISLIQWIQFLSWIYIWNQYAELSHFGKQAIFIEWFHLSWIEEQIGLYQYAVYSFPLHLLNFGLSLSLVSNKKSALRVLLLIQATFLGLLAVWGLL